MLASPQTGGPAMAITAPKTTLKTVSMSGVFKRFNDFLNGFNCYNLPSFKSLLGAHSTETHTKNAAGKPARRTITINIDARGAATSPIRAYAVPARNAAGDAHAAGTHAPLHAEIERLSQACVHQLVSAACCAAVLRADAADALAQPRDQNQRSKVESAALHAALEAGAAEANAAEARHADELAAQQAKHAEELAAVRAERATALSALGSQLAAQRTVMHAAQAALETAQEKLEEKVFFAEATAEELQQANQEICYLRARVEEAEADAAAEKAAAAAVCESLQRDVQEARGAARAAQEELHAVQEQLKEQLVLADTSADQLKEAKQEVRCLRMRAEEAESDAAAAVMDQMRSAANADDMLQARAQAAQEEVQAVKQQLEETVALADATSGQLQEAEQEVCYLRSRVEAAEADAAAAVIGHVRAAADAGADAGAMPSKEQAFVFNVQASAFCPATFNVHATPFRPAAQTATAPAAASTSSGEPCSMGGHSTFTKEEGKQQGAALLQLLLAPRPQPEGGINV